MKILRYIFIAIAFLFFYTLFLGGAYRNIYLAADGGKGRFGVLVEPLKFAGEIPSMIGQLLEKDEYMEKNESAADGFSFYKNGDQEKYPKLLVGYKTAKFGQEFDLMDINSGQIIKNWKPDNKKLYELGYNEKNPRKPIKGSDLYFMHPLMTSDSSLIFTSQLSSLIARIDSNSEIVWVNNDKTYHHTLEIDSDGNLWGCTRPFDSKEYSFFPNSHNQYRNTLLDDHIAKLDPETGEILFEKSVMDILVENGYKDLILYKGQLTSDPIHLNDVQPALEDTEYWNKGDVLISCRNLSTVFLYRPTTNKIIWLQHGPWYTQHDADFYEEDKIVVFGNDVIRDESRIDPPVSGEGLAFSKERPNNEVYVYSFSTDSTTTPYAKFMKSENVRTITSGRCDILENGDLFVEETNYGRILIGDSISKKVEFVKRLDQEHVSRLFWSRVIN